jgi:hypothetical protein
LLHFKNAAEKNESPKDDCCNYIIRMSSGSTFTVHQKRTSGRERVACLLRGGGGAELNR